MQLALHIHCLLARPSTARTRAEMPKLDPWDSHGKQVSGTPKASTPSYSSDLRLECGDSEGLDNSTGWLCFHFDLLPKGHTHSRLGGWLHTGLDPAKARNCEDAVLLHFCCGKGCQALEEP